MPNPDDLAIVCKSPQLPTEDNIRRHTCPRGHTFYMTRIEWISYKGASPMPCPICTRG